MQLSQFEHLLSVVWKLRHPQEGCPWDLKQDHQSLKKYLIEETFEYVHAVEGGDLSKVEEELGDVLLQVLLNSVIAEQNNTFSLESVSQRLAHKLITRHPHVFNVTTAQEKLTPEEVLNNWHTIKEEEKRKNNIPHVLDDSDTHMPALMSAHRIGKKTEKIKFDWEDHHQVLYKVEEEWQELKEELVPGVSVQQHRVQEELGDLLFSIAQLARHLQVDPEEALRQANKKFIRRFQCMEQLARQEGINFADASLETKEDFWNKAKRMLEKK